MLNLTAEGYVRRRDIVKGIAVPHEVEQAILNSSRLGFALNDEHANFDRLLRIVPYKCNSLNAR